MCGRFPKETHNSGNSAGNSEDGRASGGDGNPADLFQTLKDDAVKILHSIYQQIWKTQWWPQDWKCKFSF